MFGLFRKKEYSISFDPSLVNELDEVLTETYEILRDEAYTAQADCIAKILVTVKNEDPAAFKKAVLTNDLLGGAGSVVDVWLEDERKMKRLDELLNRFLRLTYDGGLMHKAVKSRMNEKKKD